MQINRDSAVLWVGVGLALVGYLTTAETPPTQWTYNEWLQFASAALACLMTKLQHSPLPGKPDGNSVTPRP